MRITYLIVLLMLIINMGCEEEGGTGNNINSVSIKGSCYLCQTTEDSNASSECSCIEYDSNFSATTTELEKSCMSNQDSSNGSAIFSSEKCSTSDAYGKCSYLDRASYSYLFQDSIPNSSSSVIETCYEQGGIFDYL